MRPFSAKGTDAQANTCGTWSLGEIDFHFAFGSQYIIQRRLLVFVCYRWSASFGWRVFLTQGAHNTPPPLSCRRTVCFYTLCRLPAVSLTTNQFLICQADCATATYYSKLALKLAASRFLKTRYPRKHSRGQRTRRCCASWDLAAPHQLPCLCCGPERHNMTVTNSCLTACLDAFIQTSRDLSHRWSCPLFRCLLLSVLP